MKRYEQPIKFAPGMGKATYSFPQPPRRLVHNHRNPAVRAEGHVGRPGGIRERLPDGDRLPTLQAGDR